MLHQHSAKNPPEWIRVSLGSAIVLGLSAGKLDAAPTTAYLMTYNRGKCTANCGFCPQAKSSNGRADMLSRVSWPIFETKHVVSGLENSHANNCIRRVCIQALNYPEVFDHLETLITEIHRRTKAAISISCQPQTRENIRLLANAGAERIGIPLDAATEELFDRTKGSYVKGPYSWKKQVDLLRDAVGIFGKGWVSTHFIVGLGETEKEMVNAIQRCVNLGVIPGLFAFTPILGTTLADAAPPSVEAYRRIQLARHMIVQGLSHVSMMIFDHEGHLIDWGVDRDTLNQIVGSGEPFLTSGCPDCNRPYYNEKPSGPIYNYPKPLTDEERSEVMKELGLIEAATVE